ncbi:Fic/DOC family protein [Aliarcobacter lanthieri]|uniref:Fic/DOC family protein n=1 Tax=Aliarcobacter TaxID=2321111 RepID=UPI0021B6CFFE|nr:MULTISPECIES: Fic family protein [Aliarcobacter]MCT7545261.1 Fic family protein [Aliarcobacter cryaerophilus]MDX4064117.1 Fic family protein [Aliarcobacter skirrowii]
MASKYQLKDNSFYIKDTDIPINKFNIDDSETLHEIEKELLEEAYLIFFDELDESTVFDENYLKELHKRTFESLYEWAGIFRDFNMAKGDSRFCQGAYVQNESKKIFEALKKENYLKDFENKPKEEFAKKLAYFQCELIALHPFYELNGRITRMFFDMIVTYNGYKFINYSNFTPKEYIDASIDCVQLADCENLEKIILNGLEK